MREQRDATVALSSALPGIVRRSFPRYLPSQRWFGDKARTISETELRASFAIPGANVAAIAIIDVRFASGPSSGYVVAVGVVDGDTLPATPIPNHEDTDLPAQLVDGFALASVREWFMQTLIAGQDVPVAGGVVSVDMLPEVRQAILSAAGEPSRVLAIDQSNTALAFGFQAITKVLRRLQPGVNPDVELTRFLTAKTDFTNIPAYLGSLTFTPDDGEPCVLAVTQRFVENEGNGWSYALEALRRSIEAGSTGALQAEARATGRRLGEITAAMHLALASDPWTPAVAPEPIKPEDIRRWSDDYLSMLERIVDGVKRARPGLHGDMADLADSFLAIVPGLRGRAHGFDRLLGRAKTRVHGDYHLGQTLRTLDGDFVVLDFEGEPQRSLEERRRKTSPLKDVAGMLRSFSYARGTAGSWLSRATGLLASDLVMWERAIRAAFLDAYIAAVRAGGGGFLPASVDDTRAAIAAWELDKAAYEVFYELNNRPDWLWIPLAAMIKQGEPEHP